MNRLLDECNNFIKECGLTYAFCGGFALELHTKTNNRSHSDIDITLFDEDRKNIIDFILSKGWNVYEHLSSSNCLRLITDSNDENALTCLYLWAIKPDCTFINITPKNNEENLFDFKILKDEQLNFDFIDIIFNSKKDGCFLCDTDKNITRSLDKAILFNGDKPYLAPEIILFIISNPAYIESDYHKSKNNVDWKLTPPFLQKESMDWLLKSLEAKYPEGNTRLKQLKIYNEQYKKNVTTKFTRSIDNKTVVVYCNSDLSTQAESFLDIIDGEQKQKDILKDGYKIQIGWSMFFVAQESNVFVLYAPDFSKNPFKDKTKDITIPLSVQAQQNDILRQAKVTGHPVSFQDTMLILKEALENKDLYFERKKTGDKDDCGWYLGLLQDNKGKDRPISDYMSIFTYQLLNNKPSLLKLLSLPVGCLAVIINDELVEAVDINNNRIL